MICELMEPVATRRPKPRISSSGLRKTLIPPVHLCMIQSPHLLQCLYTHHSLIFSRLMVHSRRPPSEAITILWTLRVMRRTPIRAILPRQSPQIQIMTCRYELGVVRILFFFILLLPDFGCSFSRPSGKESLKRSSGLLSLFRTECEMQAFRYISNSYTMFHYAQRSVGNVFAGRQVEGRHASGEQPDCIYNGSVMTIYK
jgi:hypothetical protein